MKHGVNRHHEQLAAEVRRELYLSETDPFDPFAYADFLNIPCEPVSEMIRYGLARKTAAHIAGIGRKDFSAGTFCMDGYKLIVYNDQNSQARQNSDVAHELSHVMREHDLDLVTDLLKSYQSEENCYGQGSALPRHGWNEEHEEDATRLAGALLVPESAALTIVYQGRSLWEAASLYSVSEQLMEYRLDVTGAYSRVRFTDEWTA